MPTSRTFQLDVDSRRYVNRVNTFRKLNGLPNLLPPDVADIDNFVVGLKDLGVWTNTVCWLMGSKYNVGAGTSVLSIGSKSADMALTNSPTWGASGMSFVAASSQKAKSNIYSYDTGRTGFGLITAFYAPSTTQSYSMFFGSEGAGNGQGFGMIRRSAATNAVEQYLSFSGGSVLPGRAITFNQWNVAASRMYLSASSIIVNGLETILSTTGQFAPISPYLDTIGFASRVSGNPTYADMTAAFGAYIMSPISLAQLESIRSLIKSSIGKSLSLP